MDNNNYNNIFALILCIHKFERGKDKTIMYTNSKYFSIELKDQKYIEIFANLI